MTPEPLAEAVAAAHRWIDGIKHNLADCPNQWSPHPTDVCECFWSGVDQGQKAGEQAAITRVVRGLRKEADAHDEYARQSRRLGNTIDEQRERTAVRVLRDFADRLERGELP